MSDPNIFNYVLVWPILNGLIAIYKLLFTLSIPYALGFSIIILTALIRFALYPMMASQLKASKKMQELSPHLSKLKEKHKEDAKRLQQETMRLYKEHGVNPAAGCLPMLVQLPIIWGLYSVLQQIVRPESQKVISEINKVVYFDFLKITNGWDTNFFGLPLGSNPANLLSTLGPLIFLVPIITGVLQFIQSKMLFTPASQNAKNKDLPAGRQEKKKDDFASAFQSQSTYIFPIMIGFFSYTFPIGLSLYWNTFTLFGIIQQYQIVGLGGLESWKNKLIGKSK
ncbi:MAG: membrane protein insertase YidC [Candidatus Levybacteria bacterium]|nr:membrane protein insertase YidC [Candidatus Levybacteria bacterium]